MKVCDRIRLGPRLLVLSGLATAIAAFALIAGAAQASPLTWGTAGQIDTSTPGAGLTLRDVTCPQTTFCSALDSNDNVLITRDPTDPHPVWTRTPFPPASNFDPMSDQAIGALNLSCASASLCVVSTEDGLYASTDPADPHPEWHETGSAAGAGGWVSCVAGPVCVAINGDAFVSTDPQDPDATWTDNFQFVKPGSFQFPPTWLSCASVTLCVNSYTQDTAQVSTNPTDASPSWPTFGGRGMLGFGTLDGCGGSACVAASPTEIDSSTDPAIVPWHATPFTGAQAIAGAACASSTLCAVLTGAEFVASTDPGDASPAWKTSALPPGFIPDAGQHALACAGGFCLGVGRDGEAAVTTDPGDSSPHWSTARVDGVENLRVACVSRSLCVASDSGGRVLISSDPGASNASWHSSPTGASGLSDIACPSRTLCVAVSSDGHGYVTTDPTDPSPTWTPSTIETPGTNAGSLQSVACLSASLCAASDLFGNVFVSTDPASGAWRATRATTGLGFACTDAGECYSATTPAVVNIADPQASVHFGGAPQTSVGTAIACVGDALCLLGDSRGEITTTADPNDAMPTWSPVQAASSAIRAISCASSTLCVATDAAGEALVSSDPASATATWEPVSLDLGSGANSVSCTRDRLCVVVDDSGREVAAVDPSFAAPNVETGAASDLSSSQATVAGTVDPNNVAVSDCELQWGTTPEFLGTLVGCDSPPGDGNAPVPVTATVSGLDPATTYYYRFVAENEVDRTYGPDRTFRTLASSPSPPPPPPVTCRQGSKWRIRLARGGLRSTTGPDGGVTISVGGQRVLRLTRGRHGDTLSVGRHTVRVTSASSRIMTRHGAHGYTITAGGGRVKVVVVISGDRAVITRYGCSTS